TSRHRNDNRRRLACLDRSRGPSRSLVCHPLVAGAAAAAAVDTRRWTRFGRGWALFTRGRCPWLPLGLRPPTPVGVVRMAFMASRPTFFKLASTVRIMATDRYFRPLRRAAGSQPNAFIFSLLSQRSSVAGLTP